MLNLKGIILTHGLQSFKKKKIGWGGHCIRRFITSLDCPSKLCTDDPKPK